MIILFLLFVILAYLLGSVNSAIIVCKLMNLPDPRGTGSGNPGATNVMRLGGRNAATIVLVADALKGFIPVLLASWLGIHGFALGLIALAAVIGHMYPVFFNFKGGKGVATTLGALLALSLFIGIIALLIWIIVAYSIRYVSVASMSAVVSSPIIALLFGPRGYFIPLLIIAALVVFRHYSNIQKLQLGTENKLEF